jgi:hypothetical protein
MSIKSHIHETYGTLKKTSFCTKEYAKIHIHISNLEGNGKQLFSTHFAKKEGFAFLILKICIETTLENFVHKTCCNYFQAYDVTLICSLFVRILYSIYMLYNK